MVVYYRDNIGVVSAKIDFNNVVFFEGECYFSCNGEEYRIKTDNIIAIERI